MATNAARLPRLPDPRKLSGQHQWVTWLPAIEAKLRIDRDAIGPENEALFFYLYDRLDEDVQKMVLPQLSVARQLGDYNPQIILDQLDRIYADPRNIEHAGERLGFLKQDGEYQGFGIYLGTFERLFFEAEAHDWSDSDKIALFRAGLAPDVQESLEDHWEPLGYEEFVALVKDVEAHRWDDW
jgi:hypothetical protein